MCYRYEPFDPSEEEGEDEAHKKLKELCLMMVAEAVKRDGFEDMYADLSDEEE